MQAQLRATVLGATGMVGIEVLHQCLGHPRIERVVTIGRRKTGVLHTQLREAELADFRDYSVVEQHLRETDVVFHCLGVYQGKVPPDQYWEVTCTYLKHLIDVLERVRPQVTFCLFSAQGADASERSPLLFAKAKGRAERLLTESALGATYIFRPGFINPGRKTSRSRIPAWLVRPFYKLIPAIGIDAAELARVMVHVGTEGSEQRVFGNRDIRRLAVAVPAESRE